MISFARDLIPRIKATQEELPFAMPKKRGPTNPERPRVASMESYHSWLVRKPGVWGPRDRAGRGLDWIFFCRALSVVSAN